MVFMGSIKSITSSLYKLKYHKMYKNCLRFEFDDLFRLKCHKNRFSFMDFNFMLYAIATHAHAFA